MAGFAPVWRLFTEHAYVVVFVVTPLLWSSTFLGLGYLLGDQWSPAAAQWDSAGLAIAALLVATAAATVTMRLWRRHHYGPGRPSREGPAPEAGLDRAA